MFAANDRSVAGRLYRFLYLCGGGLAGCLHTRFKIHNEIMKTKYRTMEIMELCRQQVRGKGYVGGDEEFLET